MMDLKSVSSLSPHQLYAQTSHHVPPGGNVGQRLPAPRLALLQHGNALMPIGFLHHL